MIHVGLVATLGLIGMLVPASITTDNLLGPELIVQGCLQRPLGEVSGACSVVPLPITCCRPPLGNVRNLEITALCSPNCHW